MNERLKSFFEEQLTPADDIDEYTRALGIKCATAALLIEVSKSDSEQDEVERTHATTPRENHGDHQSDEGEQDHQKIGDTITQRQRRGCYVA